MRGIKKLVQIHCTERMRYFSWRGKPVGIWIQIFIPGYWNFGVMKRGIKKGDQL